MLLPTHTSVVGYDKNRAVVESAKPSVVLIYATRLINDGSYITASDDVLPTPRVYMEAMKRLNARNLVDKWSVVGGLFYAQNFPKNISRYQSTYHCDQILLKQARNLPYYLWLEKFTNRLKLEDMQILYSAEAGALQVSVRQSMSHHWKAGRVDVFYRRIGNKEVVSHYQDTVAYETLAGVRTPRSSTGKG